mgnify:FL=1|jgi:hypothetical protein
MSKEDKYWEYDEIEENYKLHFTRFYEDEIIAILHQDDEFGIFCAFYILEDVYKSDVFDYLNAETIEDAKAEVEERIVDLVQEQIEYLQSWIHKFKSTDADENRERLEKGGINHVD